MNIKKIVAGSLITSLSATVVILAMGILAPSSFLDNISSRYFEKEVRSETVALDKNGVKIVGATISKDADGDITVTDAAGNVIEDASTKTQPTSEDVSETQTVPPASSASGAPAPSPTPSPTPAPKPTPTPTPAPPPPPPTPQCGSGGPCTAAQVAAHNTKTNCWVIHSGKVYNITAYIPKHPKSTAMFNTTTCGKSITAYLTGTREPVSGAQYRHTTTEIADINPYYIAVLA